MTQSSNCREFEFLVNRKEVYTSNDVASLLAQNRCLLSEVEGLTEKVESLEQQGEEFAISLVKSSTDASGNIVRLDQKIEAFVAQQEVTLSVQSSAYKDSVEWFNYALGILTVLFAALTIISFLTISNYKKREQQKLVDDAKSEVKELLRDRSFVATIASGAIASEILDQGLDNKIGEQYAALEQTMLQEIEDRLAQLSVGESNLDGLISREDSDD